jgi:hypothetical protein
LGALPARAILLLAALTTLLTALAGLLRLLAGIALFSALLAALIVLIVLSLLAGIALAAALLALIGHRALLVFILVHFGLHQPNCAAGVPYLSSTFVSAPQQMRRALGHASGAVK